MTIKSTFYILTILILVSCGQKNTSEENKSNSTNLTEVEKIKNDSIELEKHYSYYKKTTYENYRQYNTKIVADYEKERDTLSIIDFLESHISKIFTHEDFPFEPSDLIKYVFLIDINNDADKDVIYQGPTGGEPNMTVIFLKQDKNYLEVFRQYQDIFEIEFMDDKLSRLALTNPGCCADPQVVDYFYSVSYNDNKPTFKLERTIGYLSSYEKPKNNFSQAKSFTVTQDNAKLRNECYELDTEHPYYGESGNILTTYKKGSTGRAFAEKNENGVFWLYVLMDKKNKFDNNDFPTFKEQPIELYGWIKKNETDLK